MYEKVKKFCSLFFYLNNNKKWLMWYKKWKKFECFDYNFFLGEMKNKERKWESGYKP
jgi:hypothetical protein